MRMLRLSGLDSDDMTDDQRDAFINVAENLGLEPGDAEDMVDRYLEEIDGGGAPTEQAAVMVKEPPKVAPAAVAPAPVVASLRSTPRRSGYAFRHSKARLASSCFSFPPARSRWAAKRPTLHRTKRRSPA